MKKNISVSSIPFGQLKDSILVIKVGSDERPAGPEDIRLMMDSIKDILGENSGCRVLVTHHAVDFVLLGTKGLKKAKKLIGKRQKKHSKNAILSLND